MLRHSLCVIAACILSACAGSAETLSSAHEVAGVQASASGGIEALGNARFVSAHHLTYPITLDDRFRVVQLRGNTLIGQDGRGIELEFARTPGSPQIVSAELLDRVPRLTPNRTTVADAASVAAPEAGYRPISVANLAPSIGGYDRIGLWSDASHGSVIVAAFSVDQDRPIVLIARTHGHYVAVDARRPLHGADVQITMVNEPARTGRIELQQVSWIPAEDLWLADD